MKFFFFLALAVILISQSCTNSTLIQFTPLKNTELAYNWLLTDCRVDDDSILFKLKATDSSLYSYFRSAFISGPDSGLIHTLRIREDSNYSRRHSFNLDSLSNPDLYYFLHYIDNRDSSIADETRKFTGLYKTRALQGVSMISTKTAHDFLDSIIADSALIAWQTTAQYLLLNPF